MCDQCEISDAKDDGSLRAFLNSTKVPRMASLSLISAEAFGNYNSMNVGKDFDCS